MSRNVHVIFSRLKDNKKYAYLHNIAKDEEKTEFILITVFFYLINSVFRCPHVPVPESPRPVQGLARSADFLCRSPSSRQLTTKPTALFELLIFVHFQLKDSLKDAIRNNISLVSWSKQQLNTISTQNGVQPAIVLRCRSCGCNCHPNLIQTTHSEGICNRRASAESRFAYSQGNWYFFICHNFEDFKNY